MVRKASTKTQPVTIEPATPAIARQWLLEHQEELPEGVTVSARGKLSNAARTFFTSTTNRPIVGATA